MSRLAVLASLMLVAQHDSAIGNVRPRRILPHEFAAETFPGTPTGPAGPIPVVHHSFADHESQFGLIPTDAQARTELIPTTWQAQTVLVKNSP